EYIKKIKTLLEKHGIRAGIVYAKEKSALQDFLKGEVDVLLGVAIYYGLLVRGLDYPDVIRYAVFVEVPRFKFSLEVEEPNPIRLLQLLTNIHDVLPEEDKRNVEKYIALLKSRLSELDPSKILLLLEALREGKKLEGRLKQFVNLLYTVRDYTMNLLKRPEVIEGLEELPYLSLRRENGSLYILVPDAMTYLQASGRTSRMYVGGISKGLSLVLTSDEKLLNGLIRQTKWYSEDVTWNPWDIEKVKKVIVEVDRDREKIKRVLRGEVLKAGIEPVKTALLVVESPNKARTIASFFGRPNIKRVGKHPVYEVGTGDFLLSIFASGGHIYDLVTKEGFHGVLKLNGTFTPVYTTLKRCLSCGEQFTDEVENNTCPLCGSKNIVDSIEIVKVLREIAREVDIVLLGTDPDTEGEKIAWDIALSILSYTPTAQRIEFHEVTKKAIVEALKNVREINKQLVEAQIVRRVEDRWIGFELSKKLWEVFGLKTLSAGRVQTPVLGWIIERYHEHLKSRRPVFFVRLENGLTVAFDNIPIEKGTRRREIEEKIKQQKAIIKRIHSEIRTVNPPPPFSTDTMLREAVRTLRLSVEKIMNIAQDLFELGLITYHRTDSTRVSPTGRAIAREYIYEKFDKEMFVPREWMKEGAHECIRPTKPLDAEQLGYMIREGIIKIARPLTRAHFLLYDLIFRRFIASQMIPAKAVYEKYSITVMEVSKTIEGYTKILEPGFTQIYPILVKIYELKEGPMKIVEVTSKRIATVQLYTQADIIQLMKERGIGRPSTYAKIIKTLLERKYVVESKKGKLIPTMKGIKV
ncbi:MAG TPA: reverse gyrase, partial [Thermoproteales archaeon]|nr:reverse gyrase [Thermoproteales archaeon]